jgi:hypothetical protein
MLYLDLSDVKSYSAEETSISGNAGMFSILLGLLLLSRPVDILAELFWILDNCHHRNLPLTLRCFRCCPRLGKQITWKKKQAIYVNDQQGMRNAKS